jgi:hypothetical protein
MTQAMPQSKEGATEVARHVGADAVQRASDVAAAAGTEARNVVDEVKERAHDALGETREKLRVEATAQGRRVAAAMRDLGDQLEAMAHGESTQGWLPDVSRRAAGTLAKTADQIEERGPEAALADLKNFARRRPGVFLAGAVGLGFVVGRMIRAADTRALVAAAKDDDAGSTATKGRIEPPRQMVSAPPGNPIDLTAEGWQ